MFAIPNTQLEIPAEGVRLEGDLRALRVHLGVTEAAFTELAFAQKSCREVVSRWLSIGDVVLTYSEHKDCDAVPKGFAYIDMAALKKGAVI